MATTTTDAQLAHAIDDLVGGPENVASVHNCTTRLRFVVRDEAKVDLEQLGSTEGVLQAISAGGQIQVVIGTHVDRVRTLLVEQPGWASLDDSSARPTGRRRPLDTVFDFLGATFQPLIPAITGAALVQVIVLLLTQAGVLGEESPTAAVLTATGNAIFYFLPVFVAFTASSKLGANPFVGATVAAALLHPSFTAIGEQGSVAEAFGLPLFMYEYANAMFPALLLALTLAGLDRVLHRVVPRALQQVAVPTIELLVLVPLTVLVFGPIGVVAGNGIGEGLAWLSANAPFVFYVVVPALWIFLVAMGIHWALISIALVELASGSSVILGAAFGYQYAMFGVALGMLILTIRQRNQGLRDTAAAATLSVGIGGITEPTLYGLVLPYRRVLVIQMISAAASGLVLGIFGTYVIGFSPAPVLALPLLVPVIGGVLALLVGLAVPTALLQLWGYQKQDADAAGSASGAVSAAEADDAASTATASGGFRGLVDGSAHAEAVTLASPIAGTAVPLSATGDPIFSGGLIGPGLAIEPSQGRVVAPADAEVVTVPSSAHAIGLRTDSGLELLIHVGIETVALNGGPFTPRVTPGQRVRVGEVLLEFDTAAIAAAGCATTTPIVVTNLAGDQTLEILADGPITEGEPIMAVGPASS